MTVLASPRNTQPAACRKEWTSGLESLTEELPLGLKGALESLYFRLDVGEADHDPTQITKYIENRCPPGSNSSSRNLHPTQPFISGTALTQSHSNVNRKPDACPT